MSTQPGRTPAIISYITLIGCFIAISMNIEPKHAFTRFHARQAFGLHLIYHSFAIFLNLSEIGNIVVWSTLWMLYAGSLLYGFFGALGNKEQPIPGFGDHFQKWFTFIP